MPSDAIGFSFGDVVLVPFPFTNQNASKQRPAVVISTAYRNAARPDVILMAITSQLHASKVYGELLLARWLKAGLLKPSAVKPVVATLEQHLILRRLGALDPADVDALRATLVTIIGVVDLR